MLEHTRAERQVEAGACGVSARAKQMVRVGFFQATQSAGKKTDFLIGLRNFHARTLFAFTA
ncbi:MAG: hypothetical protein ACREXR_00280 [Gammaproteobacteria bacterium]